jgi:hypothetical protein
VRRNLETNALRKLLLDAMDIPIVLQKRETANTVSEDASGA